MCGVHSASLSPLALPRCSTPEQGEELCLPGSLVSEVTVTLLALLLTQLFPVLCGFTGSGALPELCFAGWGKVHWEDLIRACIL